MKIFIVYAHHEPRSFSAALLERSCEVLTARGHELRVSDLYAMRFNPVATASDFTERRFPDALQYDREQKHSSQRNTLAPDIRAEIDKLIWCDFLILQFPLWWYSVPAILKGWIDRVFVNGVAYGKGMRMDTGGLRGRRAMVAITTGCYPEMMASDGLLADLQINLWHILHGTLYYAGFDVLAPFAAWSIHYTDRETRSAYLDQYEARLQALETEDPMKFHKLEDFASDWRLKPGIAPVTVAHRARP